MTKRMGVRTQPGCVMRLRQAACTAVERSDAKQVFGGGDLNLEHALPPHRSNVLSTKAVYH